MKYVWMTAFGFGFIFFMTALGAALVFCFRGKISEKWTTIFFGFASGIMLSASIWSLLLPAFEIEIKTSFYVKEIKKEKMQI